MHSELYNIKATDFSVALLLYRITALQQEIHPDPQAFQ